MCQNTVGDALGRRQVNAALAPLGFAITASSECACRATTATGTACGGATINLSESASLQLDYKDRQVTVGTPILATATIAGTTVPVGVNGMIFNVPKVRSAF
jgi:hypothetical protein